jgi:protein-disulfide isomerase
MSNRRTRPAGRGATPAAGKGRAAAAKERAAKLREEQRRAERRRAVWQSVAAAAVIVLVVGIGVGVQAYRNRGEGPVRTPANAVDGTGFAVGNASAKAAVELYEDFQCPACREFEQDAGPALRAFVDAGAARVVYRPIAFLDRASTTRYSTRSLSAAACAADAGVFARMHDLLYANQPAEGTAGLTDDQLIALGRQAGASGEGFAACVRDKRYRAWTATVTDTASKAGVNSTPTVRVNGQPLSNPTKENLTAAIQAAQS